jgi:hypothetical protein
MGRIYRNIFGVFAAAVLIAGCGGAQLPAGAPAVSQPADRRDAAGHKALLYVTGGCGGTCTLSYPKGKVVGSLPVAGAGLCSDKKGNIFLTGADPSGNAVVYEYAHGAKTAKATLSLPGVLAEGCSVDPSSGDLAVTYLCHNCSYGPVAIFKNAKGSPTSYEQQSVFLSYCGYDNAGNLFADGNGSGGFALLELPAGGYILKPVSTAQAIAVAGQVQWDGSHLAIQDIAGAAIYQFDISDYVATRTGTTRLKGIGGWSGQSWIAGGTVTVPFADSGYSPTEVGLWKYPAGGAAKKTIKKNLGSGTLAAATVSAH